MPDPENTLVDGNRSFTGGMDSSRSPWDIGKNQYFKACNIRIPRSGGGFENRDGYRCESLDFGGNTIAQDIYESGHVEGEGWYYNGSEEVLLVSVDGYVFEKREQREGHFCVRVLNWHDRNAPRTKVWFTKIPRGSILNDGIASPLVIRNNSINRSTGPGSIGPGREGIYVQNRFFYVTPDRKRVVASDLRNPTSIQNGIDTNIFGWFIPDDSEHITAIGKQKVMLDYVEGGVLVFSTEKNIYSVDVRGDRQDWGEVEGSGYGRVQETIPGIGATSSYSFENFNTNLYFRTRHYGLCDLRQSQYQFVQEEDFESQSVNVANWMDRDTEWMLDTCYTRTYRNRLYTTVAPEGREIDGGVFWNGLVVVHARPNNAEAERFTRRYEGLHTGVRPWAITVTEAPGKRSAMYVYSHDADGVNRFYRLIENQEYDLNHKGERVEIESWMDSRAYDYKYLSEAKECFQRWYSIREMRKDVEVTVRTRTENHGPWQLLQKLIHRVIPMCKDKQLVPGCHRKHYRPRVNMAQEPENSSLTPSSMGGRLFYSRQYRFEITGSFNIDRIISKALPKDDDVSPNTQKQEDRIEMSAEYDLPNDFSYDIALRTRKH